MDIANRITSEVWFVTDTVVDWVDIFTRPKYKHIIIERGQGGSVIRLSSTIRI